MCDDSRHKLYSSHQSKEEVQYYSFFRLDFVVTVRDGDGKPCKILIELQKSWDMLDVMRFCKYFGKQPFRNKMSLYKSRTYIYRHVK
jgi:hypothetical protein